MNDFGIDFFNPAPSSVIHLDLNSAFATIEQQANPFLRGKPVAVAAYNSPRGCILAASVEAKRLGIKTGFMVKEAKALCPGIIVLTPDPDKYRHVHAKLRNILKDYTNIFYPKSIDEFVLDLSGYPGFTRGLFVVGREIKRRIRSEVGDHLTVSVGIGPNFFLAKTASSLKKPDGLEEINISNFLNVYARLNLTDLCGINVRNEARLRSVGIGSVLDFYRADRPRLRSAFHSVLADYWYARLRGWEVDDIEFSRRSFGNSYALPVSTGSHDELFPILQKLVEKTAQRMRLAGFKAGGVHLSVLFRDSTYWHKGMALKKPLFDSREIYKKMCLLLSSCPRSPVHTLSETCFGLVPATATQLELFDDILRRESLVKALDKSNLRWGDFSVAPARIFAAREAVCDRISFGGVRELVTDLRYPPS